MIGAGGYQTPMHERPSQAGAMPAPRALQPLARASLDHPDPSPIRREPPFRQGYPHR